MNIPEEAVEVAARAIADTTDAHGGFIGTIDAARVALDAAYKFIAAQALHEAADLVRDEHHRNELTPEPHATGWGQSLNEVEADIRARANALDTNK